jgi:8-oxo-dGTP diphosphatase
MSGAGGTSIAAGVSPRRRVVVDVILLLISNGRIMLRERANTGYGDGAYEPPSGELADRETIVEAAIRVAFAAGIVIGAENVSLAHVMHDVSGGGRIAFFLSVSGWAGQPIPPDAGWFGLADLPTNMLDRARVALRNCADGMRFSTYPAFALAGAGEVGGFDVAGPSFAADLAAQASDFSTLTSLTVLKSYLGLVSHMGLIGFLGLKDSRRRTPPRHGGRKPAAPASRADPPPAGMAEDPAADRGRSGRHARQPSRPSRSDKLTRDGTDPERARVEERHLRHRHYAR